MPNSESTLASALNELAAMGTGRDREQLVALLDRLDAVWLRALVASEAQRAKSSLVDALLGREVLPSGVTPLTAVTAYLSARIDARLAGSRQFFYAAGQAELLAGAVRRWLPGELGRGTAREHLRREVREASAAEAQEKDRELAEREAAVRHVMALLDRTAKTGR